MTRDRIKYLAMILFAAPVLAVTLMSGSNGMVVSAVSDNPDVYKAKCAMCHTAKAEKFFDPSKTDEVHVEAILKGRKGEKPPYMPGFEAKGMTPEDAKALVAYMRGLRAPAQ
jgi:mono/diheme cytochrome c family protein